LFGIDLGQEIHENIWKRHYAGLTVLRLILFESNGCRLEINLLPFNLGSLAKTNATIIKKDHEGRKGERYTFYLPVTLSDEFEKARKKAYPGAPYKFVFEKLVEKFAKENK
jgi:hypothetical protein